MEKQKRYSQAVRCDWDLRYTLDRLVAESGLSVTIPLRRQETPFTVKGPLPNFDTLAVKVKECFANAGDRTDAIVILGEPVVLPEVPQAQEVAV